VIPPDLRYTSEHEWLRETDAGTVVFGITHYAQDALGDIVYVDLPDVGSQITAGGTCGEVESTKSVSEIYAPVSGEVVAVNAPLGDSPDLVNSDPYGDGWMIEVRPTERPGTLDAASYAALIGQG
jgi:glycine cleavage system H protein